MQNRESLDFRSPEVGISALCQMPCLPCLAQSACYAGYPATAMS